MLHHFTAHLLWSVTYNNRISAGTCSTESVVAWNEGVAARRGVAWREARPGPCFATFLAPAIEHSEWATLSDQDQEREIRGRDSSLCFSRRTGNKVIQSSVTMLDQFLLLTVFGESESLQNSFWISLCSQTVNIFCLVSFQYKHNNNNSEIKKYIQALLVVHKGTGREQLEIYGIKNYIIIRTKKSYGFTLF